MCEMADRVLLSYALQLLGKTREELKEDYLSRDANTLGNSFSISKENAAQVFPLKKGILLVIARKKDTVENRIYSLFPSISEWKPAGYPAIKTFKNCQLGGRNVVVVHLSQDPDKEISSFKKCLRKILENKEIEEIDFIKDTKEITDTIKEETQGKISLTVCNTLQLSTTAPEMLETKVKKDIKKNIVDVSPISWSLIGWSNFFTKDDIRYQLEKIQKQTYDDTSFVTYPALQDIFAIFRLCPLEKIKVIIIGQDPYINLGEAMGVAFSVPKGVKVPPSLKNIFKELENDGFSVKDKQNGSLLKWVDQGVFLINTALTVEAGKSNSHKKMWATFTAHLFHFLNTTGDYVVIMWGKPAQAHGSIFGSNHKRIESPHPSPFSATTGFFGSKPFSKANELLKSLKKEPINWSL